MAKFLGSTGVQYLWTKIAGEFVAKVEGKGLSTKDFTEAYETKLIGIEAGAQVNVLDGIKVGDSNATITDKKADITSGVNGLITAGIAGKADKATTLEGYGITDAYTKAQTDTKISEQITAAKHASLKIADTNPMAAGFKGEDNVIYLYKVEIGEGGNKQTYYDMYIKVDGKMTLIDDTRMDLSDYVTKTLLSTTLEGYYTKAAADGKFVAQVPGKGLSTEDFTTTLKTKLEGIAEGAQVNKIEGIKLNGAAVNIGADKTVDITIAVDEELTHQDIDAAITAAKATA